MKRKLMRMAALYVSERAEDAFPDDETMTPEKFMKLTRMEFVYDEIQNGSRRDARLTIVEEGDVEAVLMFNISR